MITPNVCNDMHDCPVATGDAWLKKYVALIVASPPVPSSKSLALFITFDENNQSSSNQIPDGRGRPLACPRPARGDPLHPLLAC